MLKSTWPESKKRPRSNLSRVYASLLVLILGAGWAVPAGAGVTDWQKGASMTSWSADDFAQPWFRRSLANLRAAHADSVAFVIPYYQSSLTSHDLGPGPHTPSDAALGSAIDYARSLGLMVALKPHLQVTGSAEWRARISAADRGAWFKAYGDMLVHYARLAQAHGADTLILGTELINMAAATVHPNNTDRWREMIRRVREVFSGKLTYSANWGSSGWNDEKAHIEFWDDLDYIGISAYFYMTNGNGYSMATLRDRWDYWNTEHVEPLARRWGKQVVFTEVGYRSMTGALDRPPRWDPSTTVNETEQADGYEALMSYWHEKPFFAGMFLWDWENFPDSGGPRDTGFTPQNKKAQDVMVRWFGNGNAPGDIRSFRGTAAAVPASPQAGETTEIAFEVTNAGTVASDLVVNLEIWDEEDRKVFQTYVPGQTFIAQETKEYSAEWNPQEMGDYKINLSVFSPDWRENYMWREAGRISVTRSQSLSEGEVLILGSDIASADLHGTWAAVEDPSAANGILVRDQNRGTPKAETAKSQPENYFEVSFPAEAGRAYHVWFRMKADKNFYGNDSVHAQFSDSINDRGEPAYRIGTTDSLAIVLEEGHGAGEDGWGWNDNHYGLLGSNISFDRSGTHTLRVQSREDGVAIDQIVISPARFLTTRPGETHRDATVYTRSGSLPMSGAMPTSTVASTAPETAPTSTATSTPSDANSTSTATSTPPLSSGLPAGTLDVWWPANDAVLSGNQPFKVMLREWDVDKYEAYWQVDGDRENRMYTSFEDWPHKEAWTDLSEWKWRGSGPYGPYELKFLAKDEEGNIIADKGVIIQVSP